MTTSASQTFTTAASALTALYRVLPHDLVPFHADWCQRYLDEHARGERRERALVELTQEVQTAHAQLRQVVEHARNLQVVVCACACARARVCVCVCVCVCV